MMKRRQQQMSGFQGGGRPPSAAGRRRAPNSAQRNALSPVEGDIPKSNGRSSGIANPAFDEPEITEVLSNDNYTEKSTKKVGFNFLSFHFFRLSFFPVFFSFFGL